jgi:osmoprotectant transport system permease protein
MSAAEAGDGGRLRRAATLPALLAGWLVLLLALPHAGPLFAGLAPAGAPPVYARSPLLTLALNHLLLVGVACAIALGLGLGTAIAVTRGAGAAFRPLVESLVALGQTIPPVAVLALAVPMIGFGAVPTIVALVLYGLLPVLQTALAAFDGTPPQLKEAAAGMGLSPGQMLRQLELPLAAPLVLAALRTSAATAMGTATIGSVVGASTLGDPIIAGLVGSNPAFVVEGCIAVAATAIAVDGVLRRLERASRRR